MTLLLMVAAAACTTPAPTGTPPQVNAVAPGSGLNSGGYRVTVSGSGFTGATQVKFGINVATNVVVVSDSSITVDAPPSLTAGAVDVRVTSPKGTSPISSSARFTYVDVPAPPCTINWTGPEAGDWATTAAWTPARVPAAADVVCIPAGRTVTVSTTAAATAVTGTGALTINGTLTLTGTGPTGSAITTLNLTGTLAGSGDLTVTGSLVWRGGRMTGSGVTRVAAGATALLRPCFCGGLPPSDGILDSGRVFENQGLVQMWDPAAGSAVGASLLMQTGARILNAGTWNFPNAEDYPTAIRGGMFGDDSSPSFANSGTLNKSGPTTTTIAVPFTNTGSVNVNGGILRLWGAQEPGLVTDTGPYTVAAGASVVLATGARELATGSSVGGAGAATLGGDVRVSGSGVNVGSLTVESLLVRLTSAGYPVFRSSGQTTFSSSVELRAEEGFCPTQGQVITPFRFGSSSGTPSVSITDAEFTTTTAVLPDRINFTVTSVSCDVVAPTMSGFTLEAPKASDRLLERVVTTDASDNRGVTRYEYIWTPGTTASTPAGTTRSVAATGQAFNVSFADAQPNSAWSLFVRAVDRKGNTSPWRVWRVPTTPKRPKLIAIGDSVTAGYHRDSGSSPTSCNDPVYGYPAYIQQYFDDNVLPSNWRFQYSNYARAGFQTADVLALPGAGMRDACGTFWSSLSPIGSAVADLQNNAGSWNRVVVSAGVNDTNWGDVLISMIIDPTVPILGTTQCLSKVDGFNIASKSTQIADNVDTILDRLEAADYAAKITWNSYYGAAGTGPLNSACASAVAEGTVKLHEAIQTGLYRDHRARWIDNSNVSPSTLQGFYPSDLAVIGSCRLLWGDSNWKPSGCEYPPGWPHPAGLGAKTIANNNIPNLG
jgi:hypothetical protein